MTKTAPQARPAPPALPRGLPAALASTTAECTCRCAMHPLKAKAAHGCPDHVAEMIKQRAVPPAAPPLPDAAATAATAAAAAGPRWGGAGALAQPSLGPPTGRSALVSTVCALPHGASLQLLTGSPGSSPAVALALWRPTAAAARPRQQAACDQTPTSSTCPTRCWCSA